VPRSSSSSKEAVECSASRDLGWTATSSPYGSQANLPSSMEQIEHAKVEMNEELRQICSLDENERKKQKLSFFGIFCGTFGSFFFNLIY
jgi:hypothetical protein